MHILLHITRSSISFTSSHITQLPDTDTTIPPSPSLPSPPSPSPPPPVPITTTPSISIPTTTSPIASLTARAANTHMRSQAERYEHDEEQDGPQRRHGHARHGGRVHDEGQAGARGHDVLHLHAELRRQEAQDAEDDEAGEHGRRAVGEGDHDGVSGEVYRDQFRFI